MPVHQLSVIYPKNYYSFTGNNASMAEKIKQALDKRRFKECLKKIQSPLISVLDIGGGTGWMLDAVKQCDARVTFTQVVDMDAQAGAQARAKGHAYFKGPIESFTTNKRFQIVLMFNLIEHVRDPVKVLKKIEKILAPGGLLLVKTPNIDSLDARLFRHSNWGGYHCPRHWVLFNENSFKIAQGQTSLELLSQTYTQGAPFWAQSVMMKLRRWKWIHYTKEKPLAAHPLFPILSAFFAGFDFARGLFFKTSQMLILLRKPA